MVYQTASLLPINFTIFMQNLDFFLEILMELADIL